MQNIRASDYRSLSTQRLIYASVLSFVVGLRIEIPGLATTSPIARLRVGSGGGEMGAISAGVGATQERPYTLQPHGHSPHHTFSPTTRASPTQVSELNKLRF